jgi:hypothetical protein
MFTIYCYNVGERKHDRYFRSWDRAKEELEKERHGLLKSGWTEIGHRDYFNSSKGFYVFDYTLRTPDGEEASLSLIDGYFSD